MCVDPFKEVDTNSTDPSSAGKAGGGAGWVHIRVQQRNGRKCLTTVQGIDKGFSYSKLLKDLKKEFCCNGNVVQDLELRQVIQLQGDQRKNVSQFLVKVIIMNEINAFHAVSFEYVWMYS